MQELEKILKKIEKLKKMYKESSLSLIDKGNLPCEYDKSDIESAKMQAISEAITTIRKHMNDDWIPVVRGLPELNEDGLSEDVMVSFLDSYNICIAFYDLNEKRWYVHGSGPCIGRVVAWRPLPEPYRPERSVH